VATRRRAARIVAKKKPNDSDLREVVYMITSFRIEAAGSR
jgi:hypothetical protein